MTSEVSERSAGRSDCFRFAATRFDNRETCAAAARTKTRPAGRSNNPFNRTGCPPKLRVLREEGRESSTSTDLLSRKKFQLVKSRCGYEERLICRRNYRHSVKETYVGSLPPSAEKERRTSRRGEKNFGNFGYGGCRGGARRSRGRKNDL